MSSEQVIAEMRAFVAAGDPGWPEDMIADWADRLSTPAASTGDAVVLRFAPEPHMEVGRSQIYNRMTTHPCGAYVLYADYAQLQARNAEREAELGRYMMASNSLASKLTALLDGIEGLEAKVRRPRVIEQDDIADLLKALREKANGSDD